MIKIMQQFLIIIRKSLTLVLFFSAVILTAVELPERGWTIGSSTGVLWGNAREIVYGVNAIETDNEYLSLLIWELIPVLTLGINAFWASGTRMSVMFDFHSAIPGMDVGEMNDYDWCYTDKDWSHWSSSDVSLRWGFLLNAVSSWQVVDRGPFSVKLGLGYHMDWWSWRDKITDSIYSDSGKGCPKPFQSTRSKPLGFRDIPDKIPTGVNGINYNTIYHVPLFYLTINLEWNTFFVNFNSRIGPVLAFSHDHHVLRNLDFYDWAFGGPWIDVLIEAGFHSSGRFSFTLRGEYAWMNEIRGDTIVEKATDQSFFYNKGVAGFAFRRIGVTALFTWHLSGS